MRETIVSPQTERRKTVNDKTHQIDRPKETIK
jgi:hypothetical protein